MSGNIFINYRRDETSHVAGRLHDRLAQTFGRDRLFMDVDNIPIGFDFEDYLKSQVAECNAMLSIIGPNWLNAKDETGRRRLDNPEDFVAIEIAAALARNIPVVPVLVDGAHMPKASELPESIKPLARRNAVQVHHTNFGSDADALVAKMREALNRREHKQTFRGSITSIAKPVPVAVLLIAVAVAPVAYLYSPYSKREAQMAPPIEQVKPKQQQETQVKAKQEQETKAKQEQEAQATAKADLEDFVKKQALTATTLSDIAAMRKEMLKNVASNLVGDLPRIESLGLDVSYLTDELRSRYKINSTVTGAVITSVKKDSGAAGKNVLVGDVITAVQQQPVASPAEAENQLEQVKQSGRKAAVLLIVRESTPFFVALTLP